ncbi:hypothetical protein I6I18_02965 [Kytococcus sedentarius]|uniref:Uncharacterized protein n=1 Tax=Kytococcus sedentarius (strain ATCC 14392 / DSM 20547 / JCM 11482 / CCUG 33030 / NBRC 15357 / NCTC 11040 / CCM 314 / 541) TaxID=478801 RepID=C7NGH2_KYTSD|nr:hypothetical protein [Kytococcus sedentarius]ACV06080.1 hypothetical protein Ksed_10350 [Kytococcus sedentarius DSM 20547]OLT35298.1 hypothetical protein BJF82_00560 [Kytococcus sp. CUA-901]QQB65329.1 hypothetical protein I6I18_02965 [Kytococcus sedentarius]STX12501.1 Uncharacterised protein [Kytococcus sedentarius]
MTTLQSIYARLVTAYARMAEDTERGDVPGWVLITMMTAGIVTALWALAGPMLNNLFTSAVSGVHGP